jgi:hypothetical protein
MKHAIFLIVIACLWLPGAARAASLNLTATVKLPSICGNNIREDGEQCDGPDLGASSCSVIGFDGGPLSCTPSCTFEVSLCAAPTQVVFTSSFPVAGGSYTFTAPGISEVSLTVPPNSATDTLTLFTFVRPTPAVATSSPVPDNTSFVGKVYDLDFVSSDGDVVHTVVNPVTVVLPYTDDQVQGLDVSSLAAYRKEDGETLWNLIPGSTVDAMAHTVSFTTISFSMFTIFGKPPPVSSLPAPIAAFAQAFSGGVQRTLSWVRNPIVALKSLFGPRRGTPGDLNADTSVGIQDFSIMAYWYHRPHPPQNVDLNGDGAVDLADFSILVHDWSGSKKI